MQDRMFLQSGERTMVLVQDTVSGRWFPIHMIIKERATIMRLIANLNDDEMPLNNIGFALPELSSYIEAVNATEARVRAVADAASEQN